MPAALSRGLGGLGEPHPWGAMARRAGTPSMWSGNERLRVGERLQASLAGILELDLLRETQRESVESALGCCTLEEDGRLQQDNQNKLPPSAKLDRNSYRSSEDVEIDTPGCAGDGPDKSCLGLRMANEQLCFPKKAGGGDTQEILEADSRPSSGFYETSEMGSLSDSCASIHSDGAGGSRYSVGSLSQLPGLRESSCVRPRSTDEAAVRLLDLQLQRLALASTHGSDTRRPVSTGDLEFLLGLGDLSLPLSKNPSLQLFQYKSDLVSRNTNEIYHYPSPLHAVALQSPLFTSSLSQSSSQEDLDEGTPESIGADSPERVPVYSKDQQKMRLDRYIATLVLRYKCRSVAGRTEAGYFPGNQKSLSMSSVCSSALGASQLLVPAPGWKIRRRISTCSHMRSPEGSEGTRDSQVLDGQDFTPFLEISSIQSSRTNLSKASEPSVMSLPDPFPPYREPLFVPSPKKQPNSLERGVLDWGDGAGRRMIQLETPPRKEAPSSRFAVDLDRLYKGKHASRDLVKTVEKQEKQVERSWLSPRELFRRLSLRRKLSVRTGRRARASSEMNIHVAAGIADPHAGKAKAMKPKWTSVLEISGKAHNRPHLKAHTFQPPPGLSRHLAFSGNSPPSACFLGGSQVDLPPWQRTRLGEVDATSAVSLNGDWILHHLGDRWPRSSATLDSSDLAVGSFKLRRSRSFKELKRMMSRSIKGSKSTK